MRRLNQVIICHPLLDTAINPIEIHSFGEQLFLRCCKISARQIHENTNHNANAWMTYKFKCKTTSELEDEAVWSLNALTCGKTTICSDTNVRSFLLEVQCCLEHLSNEDMALLGHVINKLCNKKPHTQIASNICTNA